jgi:hypothetical protein
VNALAFTQSATGAARTSEETESAGAPGQVQILAGATPLSSQAQSAGTLAQTTVLNSATASSGETAQAQVLSFAQVATGAAAGSNEVESAGVLTSGVSIYTIYGATAGSQETGSAANQLAQTLVASQVTGVSSEVETSAVPGFGLVTVNGSATINDSTATVSITGLVEGLAGATTPTAETETAGAISSVLGAITVYGATCSSNEAETAATLSQNLKGAGATANSSELDKPAGNWQIIYTIAGATSGELTVTGPATPGLTHSFGGVTTGPENKPLPGIVSSNVQTIITLYSATLPSQEIELAGLINIIAEDLQIARHTAALINSIQSVSTITLQSSQSEISGITSVSTVGEVNSQSEIKPHQSRSDLNG